MATAEEVEVIALMVYAILHGHPDAIKFSEDGKSVIVNKEELEIINNMLEKEN